MNIDISLFFLQNQDVGDFADWQLDNLRLEVEKNFHKAKVGYRDGVVLVPIDPKGYICPIVVLKDENRLMGRFQRRAAGEEPRKKMFVPNVEGTPAKFVDVVCYRRDVLAETNEESQNQIDSDGKGTMVFPDWEIITILPKLDENQPMPPDTLCYNHFQLSGGTKTNMTDEQFVKALKESFIYWKDKTMID